MSPRREASQVRGSAGSLALTRGATCYHAGKSFSMRAENAEAQYGLGLLYASGQGVPQDYVFAHMWFNLSAARGHQLAIYSRDYMAVHHLTAVALRIRCRR
jgi:TPR repeat protein